MTYSELEIELDIERKLHARASEQIEQLAAHVAALTAQLSELKKEHEMPKEDLARRDGLPKPDQHSELPRLSPVLSAHQCPKCGDEMQCDEVDNGVGMQQCGPYGCPSCHYIEPTIAIEWLI